MKRNKLMAILTGAIVLAGLCGTAYVMLSQAVSTPVQDETPATQVNNLSQRIGEIEVERAIALSRFSVDTRLIEDLNRRQTALVSQLQQLEPQRYQALVTSAAQSAVSSKIGAVDVERTIALARVRADTPTIQDLDQQLVSLTARLKELQPQRYITLLRSATQSAVSSKIGAVDVERTIALARVRADTPTIQDLDQQLVSLTARLKELQPQRYITLLRSATQSAVSSKIRAIEVERTIALARVRADTPTIQDLDQQLVLLRARLKELQPQR